MAGKDITLLMVLTAMSRAALVAIAVYGWYLIDIEHVVTADTFGALQVGAMFWGVCAAALLVFASTIWGGCYILNKCDAIKVIRRKKEA